VIRLAESTQLSLLFWVRLVTRTLAVLSVVCAALLKVPADFQKAVVDNSQVLGFLQHQAWWALPALLVSVPAGDALRRWIERQTLWPLVKALLNDFRNRLYPQSTDPAHFHRVTLFRHAKWVWRWRAIKARALGWVYIVERTGHTTQNSKTIFRACNDPELAVGVAGTTWTANQLTYFEGLPILRDESHESELAQYASKTNCSLDEIRRRRPQSRSLCGIPVEVKGRVWGVLVIDSRYAELPKDRIESNHPIVAKFLGRLLERLS
jgi:hypothetical protein